MRRDNNSCAEKGGVCCKYWRRRCVLAQSQTLRHHQRWLQRCAGGLQGAHPLFDHCSIIPINYFSFTSRAPEDNPKGVGSCYSLNTHIDTHTRRTTKSVTAVNFWCKTNRNTGYNLTWGKESLFYRSTLNPCSLSYAFLLQESSALTVSDNSCGLQNSSDCVPSQIHLCKKKWIWGAVLVLGDRYKLFAGWKWL